MIDFDFLLKLRNSGIIVRAEGDRLICNAPIGSLTAELRSVLKEQKDEILELIRQTEKSSRTEVPTIPKVSFDSNPPMSFAQERLWFLEELQPGNSAYNMSWALKIEGELHRDALEESLNEVIKRHEALRTTFALEAGKTVQVVAPSLWINVTWVDFTASSRSARDNELCQVLEQEAKRPFNFKDGPLIRASLFQTDEKQVVFFFVIHHSVFDGWSFDIFMTELFSFYGAFVSKQPCSLLPPPIQYADYAYWQQKMIPREHLADQLIYWKEKLAGVPQTTLPLDYPRPAIQTFRGAQEMVKLPRNLFDSLKELAQSEGVSFFILLLSAFKILLSRYSGENDVCVGIPSAGRTQKETQSLIGFFIQTLALRTDISGNPNFREVVGKVRDVVLAAQANQDVPFERVVEELAPKRTLSTTPIFQIFFNHITTQLKSRGSIAGVSVESFMPYQGEIDSKFDLTFYVEEIGTNVRLRVVYNADIFDAERIEIILDQYLLLLKQIGDNPNREISSYSLNTSPDGLLPIPSEPLNSQWLYAVHERFSLQAVRAARNVAIIDGAGSWEYGALARSSNQIANWLLADGVEKGDIIAVYGHRSAGLVLSLLGILKAGAAFLILDPAYPATRLVKMLQAAQPAGLLLLEAAGEVGGELNEFINDHEFKRPLKVPRSKEALDGFLTGVPATAPGVSAGPNDTAYLIFTSGTAGEPKGIIGTHKPLSHFIDWHTTTFGLRESDRFSMLSGLSHDPLLRDIFTPLCVGGTLCIPEPEEMLIPERFRQWMREQGVTVSHMTPALSQVLTEDYRGTNGGEESLPALHHIYFGGDVLTGRDVERVRRVAPGVECVNFYGTTETPQAMGYHVVTANDGEKVGRPIPLGKGIEGVQLLILNPAGLLAGVGELGEICVRTQYLSEGYLNDTVLTEAKFILNPHTNVPGDRIYRTGDLGRYLPDGKLVYHGRRDRQVKVRGHRVELGEIESWIKEVKAVSTCVVVMREDRPGDQRLVEYHVLAPGFDSASFDLRGYLRTKLPDYMVPQHFVELSSIPLTPNGKVDHGNLPVPQERQLDAPAPRTLLETQLIAIWENVLGVSGIGQRDNFFDLGGHSLLTLRLLTQMEKVFNRQFPLSTIFQAQTIEEMAVAMMEDSLEFGGSLVAIQTGGSRPPLFFIPGFGGSALGYSELARLLGADQPFYCLQSLGLDGNQEPLDRVEDIASHFVGEIRKIQPSGPYHLAGLCWGGPSLSRSPNN